MSKSVFVTSRFAITVLLAAIMMAANLASAMKQDSTLLKQLVKNKANRNNNHNNNNNNASINVGAVQILPVVPSSSSSPAEIVQATSAAVVSTILRTVAQNQDVGGVDLMVFPEFLFQGGLDYAKEGVCSGDGTNSSGLLRNYCFPVPDAGQRLDCSNNSSTAAGVTSPAQQVGCALFLSGMSAATSTTASINVCELMPSNGTLYNTQVIIRNGAVVAKYRKFHPFFTSCFAKPQLELVTFPVGSKMFGVFTCFDILWHDPKMDLIKMGIKYFSYSVAIPLVGLPAVQIFSAENKVTVVTSNANGAESAVVVDGKAVSQCKEQTGTCVALYQLS